VRVLVLHATEMCGIASSDIDGRGKGVGALYVKVSNWCLATYDQLVDHNSLLFVSSPVPSSGQPPLQLSAEALWAHRRQSHPRR
jgi:hypothetical protein